MVGLILPGLLLVGGVALGRAAEERLMLMMRMMMMGTVSCATARNVPTLAVMLMMMAMVHFAQTLLALWFYALT